MTKRPLALGACLLAMAAVTWAAAPSAFVGPNQSAATQETREHHEEHEAYRQWISLGIDAGTKRIPDKPVQTTVEKIRSIQRPDDFFLDIPTLRYADGRVLGFENQEWQVSTTIRKVWEDDDGTIWMILSDKPTIEILAACPDLADVEIEKKEEDKGEVAKNGGKFKPLIEAAHKALEDKFHPTEEPQDVNVKVTLQGLGFFGDPILGNACQNGAQLRPITRVEFR